MAEIIISSVLCVCFAVIVGLAVVMAAHSMKDDKKAEKRREDQELRDIEYHNERMKELRK